MLNHKGILLSASVLLASACGNDGGIPKPEPSRMSSITLGNFNPGPEKPDWSLANLAITDIKKQATFLEKDYQKSSFRNGDSKDLSVKVPYGSYQIHLKYLNDAGRILYQSCPDEISKEHKIEASRYETTIQMCKEDTSEEVGEVELEPVSDLVITPQPVNINPSDNQAGGGKQVGGGQYNQGARFWVDPYSQAMADFKQMQQTNHPDTRYIEYIANQPAGVWYGEWSGNVANAVKQQIEGARSDKSYAVLIAYYVPHRDCGQHSAGGLKSDQYRNWISDLAGAIGSAKAYVILEPDALTLNECLSEELENERYELLQYAVDRLKQNSNTLVYIDAGHSAWLSAEEVASRLMRAGIEKADGFSLNTSNYQTTESNVAYGQKIRKLLGGKNFVVDTSRNGNGPTPDAEWCNPQGRALGEAPTTATGVAGVDAYLWLKRPGESDGHCNGGPAAGAWWREIALEQAKNAGI